MIIIGARGTALEVYDCLSPSLKENGMVRFFDNINLSWDPFFLEIGVLKDFNEVNNFFKETDDLSFTIGIGNPFLRKKLYDKFVDIGGIMTDVISEKSHQGLHSVYGSGLTLFPGAITSVNCDIGRALLLNMNASISHDCKIGDFVELGPGATVAGSCNIGDEVFIGTQASILPGVKVGSGAVIGAGSVVTKDVPSRAVVIGVPAKIIRYVDP